jgi:hypothetical protein
LIARCLIELPKRSTCRYRRQNRELSAQLAKSERAAQQSEQGRKLEREEAAEEAGATVGKLAATVDTGALVAMAAEELAQSLVAAAQRKQELAETVAAGQANTIATLESQLARLSAISVHGGLNEGAVSGLPAAQPAQPAGGPPRVPLSWSPGDRLFKYIRTHYPNQQEAAAAQESQLGEEEQQEEEESERAFQQLLCGFDGAVDDRAGVVDRDGGSGGRAAGARAARWAWEGVSPPLCALRYRFVWPLARSHVPAYMQPVTSHRFEHAQETTTAGGGVSINSANSLAFHAASLRSGSDGGPRGARSQLVQLVSEGLERCPATGTGVLFASSSSP